jgi:hypothetical protein
MGEVKVGEQEWEGGAGAAQHSAKQRNATRQESDTTRDETGRDDKKRTGKDGDGGTKRRNKIYEPVPRRVGIRERAMAARNLVR